MFIVGSKSYTENELYNLYQRYDFESKSQPPENIRELIWSCITYTKGTTLKANHNMSETYKLWNIVV